MTKVYLGLGSNVGDKLINIKKAINHIKKTLKFKKISPIYKTEPVGYKKQDWFLNCAIIIETRKNPVELLDFLKNAEKIIGRKKTRKNGPRIIDLDIIFYGKISLGRKNLKIPHEKMQERMFVLAPLKEICPRRMHPLLGKTISKLKKELERKNRSKVFRTGLVY